MRAARVSVVIPARDAARFLPDALDSVFAQGLDEPEVVVVDDGSADRTAEVARRYGHGVKVLEGPRSGSAWARNVGLQATTGELIAFLDADDIWTAEKSLMQMPLLEREPEIALVFSDMSPFDERGETGTTYFRERGFDGRCLPSSVFLYDMISTPTVILRRSCLARVGHFDETLPIGQDTDLWFRIVLTHPFAAVDRPLVRRRFHAGNVTRDSRTLAECVVRIWGRYLERIIEREPEMEGRLRSDYARKRWHHFFLEGCARLKEGRPSEARRLLSGAIGEAPLRARPYAFWLLSLVRRSAR